jgi:uncharacterized protein
MVQPRSVTFAVDDKRQVSGLLQVPPDARVCYVLAHGAGAGMSHPFMAEVADGMLILVGLTRGTSEKTND